MHKSINRTENKNNTLSTYFNDLQKNIGTKLEDNRPKSILKNKKMGPNSIANHVVQQKLNHTNLPDNLKSGIENLSGHSRDDVKVHYNSNNPIQFKSLITQYKKPKTKGKGKKAHVHKVDLKKQTMTVRNKKDKYTSGLINGLSRATGVETGPRVEAQKVKRFLGGSWIGGHMVNDQLGGNGSFKNIVPITSSMNGLHKSVENQANNLLSAGHGTQIEYKMKILKRATVKNAVKTVKNLPIEFKQTLHVYPVGSPMYTIDGYILEETNPGDGKIQP